MYIMQAYIYVCSPHIMESTYCIKGPRTEVDFTQAGGNRARAARASEQYRAAPQQEEASGRDPARSEREDWFRQLLWLQVRQGFVAITLFRGGMQPSAEHHL